MLTRISALGAAAAQLGASRSALYRGGSRTVMLSQEGIQSLGSSGRRVGAGRSRRRGVSVYAKIWTNDGRRKAAEMMGLTMEEASNEKTLKRAFRRLCLRYHPDIARDEDGRSAGDKFKELQEAYRVLSDQDAAHVELADDLEWSNHDWRWAHRYQGGGGVAEGGGGGGGGRSQQSPHAQPHKISEEVRKAKLNDQLKKMASSPVRRKRRVIKPPSKVPTPQPAGATFTMDDAGCPSDGCPSDVAEAAEHVPAAAAADVIEEGEAAEEEEKEEVEEMDRTAAAAPARRRRRVLKPLSRIPATQPTGHEFTGTENEDVVVNEKVQSAGEAAAAGAAEDPEAGSAEASFSQARNVRGYQSDRHSTESAHERINAQLAGLQRKKVIRARARGENLTAEPRGTNRRKIKGGGGGSGAEDSAGAARFYGGVGLQLEESTPERFVRLAKLAKEWREQKSRTPWHTYASAYSMPDQVKPSAKELLQAAVEGVALGACT